MNILVDKKYIDMISGGLEKFSWTSSKTASCRCPFCGDSKKNLNKKRGYLYEKEGSFFFKCHNCNVSYTLKQFIELTDPHSYKEYILERYKKQEKPGLLDVKSKPVFDFTAIYKENKLENIKSEFLKFSTNCSDLSDNHFCKVYLNSRKIPVDKFDDLYFTDNFKQFAKHFGSVETKLQEKEQRLIIPFFNEYNDLIYFQGRSFSNIGNRYITIKVKDEDKIFGMNKIDKSKVVYVVEGPIDSLFLDNGIAVGGSDFQHTVKMFKFDYVCILDNQPRNKEVVNNYFKLISNNHKIVIWKDYFSEKKDINDMILEGKTSENIMEFIKNNTFMGLRARIELNNWRKI